VFKLNEIKELIKLVDQSSLQELEIQEENSRIFIRKPSRTESVVVTSPVPTTFLASAPQAPQPDIPAVPSAPTEDTTSKAEASKTALHTIVSPMVGTFYDSPSPDAAAFVHEGSKVTEKTVVCIVEAMKLMNEIEAEIKGQIVEVLVDNGQLVEYGQPLFLVRL